MTDEFNTRINEVLTLYRKHGWRLATVILRPATRSALDAVELRELFADAPVNEDAMDALWFARPSHNASEAWELRLLSETAYALFEVFEADEDEESRAEMRMEMENRLRAYVNGDDTRDGD